MIKEEKISSLLGLAQKAGKVASGELTVEKAIQAGRAKLLLIAVDCSKGTTKKYTDMAAYYGVEIYEMFSKERLGQSIGKIHRAALAITDVGFANAIRKLCDS